MSGRNPGADQGRTPRRTMSIFCCECGSDVEAHLTSGREVYPHRRDLWDLPFWRHGACGNVVGCHHKTADRTRPLGVIPDATMKTMRSRIHRALDPLWQSGRIGRREIYTRLGGILGRDYHTAELRTADEAALILQALEQIAAGLSLSPGDHP